jgi:hypothetical protein
MIDLEQYKQGFFSEISKTTDAGVPFPTRMFPVPIINAVIAALALGDHEGEACREMQHLFARGGVFALWAAEIGQPGTAVELAVSGLDLVWLESVG